MFALSTELVDIDPGEWWHVVEQIIVHHWEKALIAFGAYAAYRLLLAYIRGRRRD